MEWLWKMDRCSGASWKNKYANEKKKEIHTRKIMENYGLFGKKIKKQKKREAKNVMELRNECMIKCRSKSFPNYIHFGRRFALWRRWQRRTSSGCVQKHIWNGWLTLSVCHSTVARGAQECHIRAELHSAALPPTQLMRIKIANFSLERA